MRSLLLLCIFFFGCEISCSYETATYKPQPIPDLTEDLDRLQVKLIWAQERVRYWKGEKERREKFQPVCKAAEESNPLPPLWALQTRY